MYRPSIASVCRGHNGLRSIWNGEGELRACGRLIYCTRRAKQWTPYLVTLRCARDPKSIVEACSWKGRNWARIVKDNRSASEPSAELRGWVGAELGTSSSMKQMTIVRNCDCDRLQYIYYIASARPLLTRRPMWCPGLVTKPTSFSDPVSYNGDKIGQLVCSLYLVCFGLLSSA